MPQFSEQPKDIFVIQGNDAILPCKVGGVPEPSVVWTFSGGPLPNHSIAKWDLTLFSVNNTAEFEGNYTCIASSRTEVVAKTAQMIVDGKFNLIMFFNLLYLINEVIN